MGSRCKTYFNIKYHQLYDGIDLSIYSSFFNLKYDLIISPNSNTDQIKFKYTGQNEIAIKNERLHIYTNVNHIIEDKPYAYQKIDGKTIDIECKYVLNDNIISFEFPNGYDKSHELVIDHAYLQYSVHFLTILVTLQPSTQKAFIFGKQRIWTQYPTLLVLTTFHEQRNCCLPFQI